jgi:hypothetical protein
MAITVVFSFGGFESILQAGVVGATVPMDHPVVNPTTDAVRPEMRSRTRAIGQTIRGGTVPRAIGFGLLIASGRGGRAKLPGVPTGRGSTHVVCGQGCSEWRRVKARRPPQCHHGEQLRVCPGCPHCRRRWFGLW